MLNLLDKQIQLFWLLHQVAWTNSVPIHQLLLWLRLIAHYGDLRKLSHPYGSTNDNGTLSRFVCLLSSRKFRGHNQNECSFRSLIRLHFPLTHSKWGLACCLSVSLPLAWDLQLHTASNRTAWLSLVQSAKPTVPSVTQIAMIIITAIII